MKFTNVLCVSSLLVGSAVAMAPGPDVEARQILSLDDRNNLPRDVDFAGADFDVLEREFEEDLELRDSEDDLELRDFEDDLELRDFEDDLELREFDDDLELRDFDDDLEERADDIVGRGSLDLEEREPLFMLKGLSIAARIGKGIYKAAKSRRKRDLEDVVAEEIFRRMEDEGIELTSREFGDLLNGVVARSFGEDGWDLD